MHQLRHPLSNAIYEIDDDRDPSAGIIRVTKDGRIGRFTADGVWVSGDFRFPVDPEMCRWVASWLDNRQRGGSVSGRDRVAAFQPATVESEVK